MIDEWIPQRDVAELFHVDKKTLRTWQKERAFPKPRYIGRVAFYRAMEIRLWQDQQWQNAPKDPPEIPELDRKIKSGKTRGTTGNTKEEA